LPPDLPDTPGGTTGSLESTAEDIFLDAVGMADPEQQAFLDRACGFDTDLRREVDSLFAAYARAPHIFNRALLKL
jgi:hypothetical protein